MEIQSKKLIGFDRYRFGDRQLLIGIGIGSADQEKLLIGRSLEQINFSIKKRGRRRYETTRRYACQ